MFLALLFGLLLEIQWIMVSFVGYVLLIETARIIRQNRVQNRTVEQITDVLVPHIQEDIVEVIRLIPQE